jgi:hypothetical protein
MSGNQRATALSLAAKGSVVAEKRRTRCPFTRPFPHPWNALYIAAKSFKEGITGIKKLKFAYDFKAANEDSNHIQKFTTVPAHHFNSRDVSCTCWKEYI